MKKHLIFYLLLTFTTYLFSQGLSNNKQNQISDKDNYIAEDFYIDANDYFDDEDYYHALENYIKAYKMLPNNAKISYKIGICYLKTDAKVKALDYLTKSYNQNSNLTNNIYFSLGQAYQYNLNFDKAIKNFNIYKENSRNIKKIALANKHINECILAKNMIKTPINGKITPISEINTRFSEYSPMVNCDETVMFFTSRRSNTTGKAKDYFDNKYYEDIYVSKKVNGTWSKPKPLTTRVNTKKHDSNVGLSPDGKTLFIYRSNKRNGDIYKSTLVNNEWTKPKALPKPINSKSTESSVCLTNDGKTMFFVSDRKSSIGGKDIYYCTLQNNGKWGKAINIGENINTKFDEDAIFLSPDEKTLYFSSKGHNTMGGYDIFKSTKNNKGEWNTPENIGYPINSVYDDIFFVLSADKKKGYFTTTNKNGSNDKDIFVIDFSTEKVKKQKNILAFLNGVITNSQSQIINNAQIIIKDKETNQIIQKINSDEQKGIYSVYLPMDKKFIIDIKKNGYLLFTKEIAMTDTVNNFNAQLKIGIPDTVSTSPIITQKLYFDFDRYILKKESESEAMRLYKMLKKYKNLVVEIAGNTDSIGSFEYNKKLSEKRAKYVVNKLVKLGIDAKRLHNTGYSFTKPIANNKLEEGRAKNRRVFVKVIDNKFSNKKLATK